jgi:hypothetical protein
MALQHRTEDDRDKGLYSKYLIIKRDSDRVVYDAFVLRYNDDPFAIPALRAYAEACKERYPLLAADLIETADRHEGYQAKRRTDDARLKQLESEGKLNFEPEWER